LPFNAINVLIESSQAEFYLRWAGVSNAVDEQGKRSLALAGAKIIISRPFATLTQDTKAHRKQSKKNSLISTNLCALYALARVDLAFGLSEGYEYRDGSQFLRIEECFSQEGKKNGKGFERCSNCGMVAANNSGFAAECFLINHEIHQRHSAAFGRNQLFFELRNTRNCAKEQS